MLPSQLLNLPMQSIYGRTIEIRGNSKLVVIYVSHIVSVCKKCSEIVENKAILSPLNATGVYYYTEFRKDFSSG